MFCWAQFTFSIAFVQKFTPGLSNLLPNFPNLSLVFLLTALLLVWKEQLLAQTLPNQDKDYLQLKKTTLNYSTSLSEQTKSNPGSPWGFLSHTGSQWDFISLAGRHTNHPLHCHQQQHCKCTQQGTKWPRDSFCGGRTHGVPASALNPPHISAVKVRRKLFTKFHGPLHVSVNARSKGMQHGAFIF